MVWTVAFISICALSMLWAIKTSLVINAMKNMLVHSMLLIFLSITVSSEKRVQQVLKLIMLSVVINAIWLLLTNQGMFEVSGAQNDVIDRLGTEGKWNANTIGMMSAIAMLISLYFGIKTKKSIFRLMYIGIVLLMIFVTLLSGSRKALLMVLIEICGFLFVVFKGKRLRAIVLIFLIISALYYMVMEMPFFYSIIGWRVDGFLASLTGVGRVDNSTQIRDAFAKDAFHVWLKYPIVGCGLDCYRSLNSIKYGMYAHNNYVELLADLGIIGTGIFYSAYLYCALKLMRMPRKNHLTWVLIIILLIMLVMDIGSVSYNSFLDKILIMTMFSYVFSNKKGESSCDDESY